MAIVVEKWTNTWTDNSQRKYNYQYIWKSEYEIHIKQKLNAFFFFRFPVWDHVAFVFLCLICFTYYTAWNAIFNSSNWQKKKKSNDFV